MRMAPETSEGKQHKEVDKVSAAPAPDREQQQERDVTAHQDYSEEEVAAANIVEEVLSKLQVLRVRISQLLGSAGPHRVVVTGDAGRRCLAFLETELSTIAAFLTTLRPQQLDAVMKKWLRYSCLSGVHRLTDRVLREVHSSRRDKEMAGSRRPRAALGFQPRKYYAVHFPYLFQLYDISEGTCRYRHLLRTSHNLGLTPQLQLAEVAGGLPLVGIDRPVKKLLRWIVPHHGKIDSSLRVMAIVGPMGIGKTALALELRTRLMHGGGYDYFQCNIMAQVPRGTDRNILLLQDILLHVSEPASRALSSDPSSQAKTMEALVRLISEHLQDKRYFIIIDGMHEASDWEEIKGAFPDTNNLGSRILVTTRVTSIAEACCSSSYDGLVHKMKPLNQIDSERLLLAKAVGSEDGSLPHNMKSFCNKILRRCDGIPLFIIGMADWLIKEQLSQQQQQRVDEDKEQVPQLPERLEQSLSSAFNDFHNNDLMLLSYMSMFPYGYKFGKDRLLWKWTREILVSWSEAEMLFYQLLDRNVITCVAANNCKHNNVDEAAACQWIVNHHIIMQQFFASKSAEMGFVFATTPLNLMEASAATATGRDNETSSRILRRLALHHPDRQLQSLLETMDLSQTRSLSVSRTVGKIPLDKFVNLVLLDLEGWESLEDEDLLQVCRSKMIFLKYLSIRNTQVSKLPKEIKELRILETLDISCTEITKLPPEVFELTDLEHLDLRGTHVKQLPKEVVCLQGHLEYLLVGDEGINSSVETAARVPHDVRRLHWLQTLATVDLTDQPADFVTALGDLCKLRVLAVTWSFHQSTDRDYCEALVSSIAKWEKLESLTIHCGLGCSMEFLGSLEKSHVPRELKEFKVTAGRFTSVPRWIDGLWFLSLLQITVCTKQAMTDDLHLLGALPQLQCLILGLDFIPVQAIEIENQGFSKLQRFSVDCPIPWLTFSTGAMPKLTCLQLKFCSIPASQICVPSGISNIGRLTEVSLCYNERYINSPSVKMTVEAVSKQVAKHRNPINLFINGVEQDDVQEADEE